MLRFTKRTGPFLLKDKYVQYPANKKNSGAENLLSNIAIEYTGVVRFLTRNRGMCCSSINIIAKPLRLSNICIRGFIIH